MGIETILPLAGSAINAMSAGDAADAQSAATQQANQLQREQYKQTREDLAPWRGSGAAANNRLMQLLGIGGSAGGMDRAALRAQLLPQYTTTTPGGPIYDPTDNYETGQGWANGIRIPRGYSQGTSTVDEAALQAAIDAQGGGVDSSSADYGSLLRNFTGQDLQNEPGYQFGLSEGQKGIDRGAAARGNFLSGAAMKALARFNQDYAGTKFGDAFNRDSANKTRQFNFLSGVSNQGQSAAAGVANAGQTMANQVGANTTALGNAQGAANIAQGNAWSGGLNRMYDANQQQQMIDQQQRNALSRIIMGGNSGWGAPPAYDYGVGGPG